jgi:ATP-dependent DNA helicase RecG
VWAFGTPYKRVGRTSQKISREETERLFDLTRGMTWDALPCAGLKLEHLDRVLVEGYLRRARQEVTQTTEGVLDNLNLRSGDTLLNGAALLFATNPQRWIAGSQVKCARFRGTTSVNFLDEQTIEGDVIAQIEGAIAFVSRNTRHTIRITGKPERDIVSEYPEEAIREAVINAVCHRDYAALGTVQVRIYDDRLEVWNPGSLPQGLNVAILYREHPSYPRNKRLADAFHRVRLIEHWGTGTLRMIAAYEAVGSTRPEFDEVAGTFIVRMPPLPIPASGLDLENLNERQRKLIETVVRNGSISFAEYLPLSGVSERQARYDLDEMVAGKYLKRVGKSRSTRYELPSTTEE